MEFISEGSVQVALGLLGLIAAVGITAILKYQTVEEALKIWGALSGLTGVVTGAFVTYFFTHQQIATAQDELQMVQSKLTTISFKRDILADQVSEFKNLLESQPANTTIAALKNAPQLELLAESSASDIEYLKNDEFICRDCISEEVAELPANLNIELDSIRAIEGIEEG